MERISEKVTMKIFHLLNIDQRVRVINIKAGLLFYLRFLKFWPVDTENYSVIFVDLQNHCFRGFT